MMGHGAEMAMGHSTGILMLSAVAGYWVLERAESRKKGLKRAGRFVGWFVIICSVVGVACHVSSLIACGHGYCPMPGKKAMCPFTGKAGMPSAAPSDSPQPQ